MLESIKGFFYTLKHILPNNPMYILVLFAFIITWIFIRKYILKLKSESKDEKELKKEKNCQLMFFYTTWCPYCKKSRVEWNNFKSYWNHKKIDDYVLSFSEIDCDTHEDIANKYNIVGYPSIILIKDDNVFRFDAKPEVEQLNQFLTASFN